MSRTASYQGWSSVAHQFPSPLSHKGRDLLATHATNVFPWVEFIIYFNGAHRLARKRMHGIALFDFLAELTRDHQGYAVGELYGPFASSLPL